MGGWGEDEALVDMMRVDQFQARNLQRRSGQENLLRRVHHLQFTS